MQNRFVECNVAASFHSSYDMEEDIFQRLYEKSKRQQWDVMALDWSQALDDTNPLALPDATNPVSGTAMWGRLDDKTRGDMRRQFQAWTLSQVLHGEQIAVICAAKLAVAETSPGARMCSAVQVVDEARHVEAYSKLLREKFGLMFDMSPPLDALMQNTISSSSIDLTNLGLQILIEGIALAIFQSIIAYTRDPFCRELIGLIARDEARHYALGRSSLEAHYKDGLTDDERRVREEFVCESLLALNNHLCADDMWEPLGFNRAEMSLMIRESPVPQALRRSMFRRVVPTLSVLGLTGGAVGRVITELGLESYLKWPAPVD